MPAEMAASFPSIGPAGERRMARLDDARLAVVTDARRDRGDLSEFLETICQASVDLVLLRDKTATEDELRAAADVVRRCCDRTGALFVFNDLPGMAVQVDADGTQVGQADVHPDHARRIVGPDVLVGRTVRGSEDLVAAADEDVDYLLVVPDDGLLRQAVEQAAYPWFAVLDAAVDAEALLDQGARRLLAGASVTGSDDPGAVTWRLRRLLGAHH